MSRQFRLSPEAEQQIDAIGAFIAKDSIDAALKIYDALEHAFQLLAENPGIGHTREDLTERPVKFWSVFSYLVSTTRRAVRSRSSRWFTVPETSPTSSRKAASPTIQV